MIDANWHNVGLPQCSSEVTSVYLGNIVLILERGRDVRGRVAQLSFHRWRKQNPRDSRCLCLRPKLGWALVAFPAAQWELRGPRAGSRRKALPFLLPFYQSACYWLQNGTNPRENKSKHFLKKEQARTAHEGRGGWRGWYPGSCSLVSLGRQQTASPLGGRVSSGYNRHRLNLLKWKISASFKILTSYHGYQS